MATNGINDLFFTGSGDPRHGCVILGEHNDKPVAFHFDTPQLPTSIRTTIYRDGNQPVAYFDWAVGVHLGTMTKGTKQQPMSYLVMRGSTPQARMFESGKGIRYEWRKLEDQVDAYDLYAGPTTQIAKFRRIEKQTPVGRSHALLEYSFDDEELLLDCLLALCLNRWIAWRGL
ncbi:hypothetical protein A0H81_04773 [Grifola frondosa]|uniref:DUF6593 domain-containing protein n=1 Tax=Grifola frondosa TaxID=5627 RepID=A0A1C7MGB9_GRIFR|nr:hypothetical protein A0H81_04773 [Grifola frondosa]